MKTQSILIMAISVIAAILLNSCEDMGFGCIRGNGDLTTEQRVVSDFYGIEVSGSFIVYIDSSNETSVMVEADENLLDEIRTQVRGNHLVIETYRDRCINSGNNMTIYVATPHVEEIALRGSGRIYCKPFETPEINVDLDGSGRIFIDYMKSDESRFDLSGSGTIHGTVDTYTAAILVEGSGEIRLDGDAHSANMDLTGSGIIWASEFTTDNADVEVTGSGKIYVYATDLLEARVTGSGIIYYYGDPLNVNKQVTGSGSIVQR
jgi:hypothetical protein